THHEVSPLTDPGLLPLLNARGYQPIELSSVLFRPIQVGLRLSAPRNSRLVVRPLAEGERELWVQTARRGWSEDVGFADQMQDLMWVSVNNPAVTAFLVELDGAAIAAGALSLFGGVALLAGAATVPETRRQGAHLALLEDRLRWGAERGCDIAMM